MASRLRSCSRPTPTTRPSASPGSRSIGRRLLPPTRLLRSGALTIDPFLLSGASLGAAWRAERGGAAGCRLPRGRRGHPARDRAAARRDAPRSRPVGAARRVPARPGRALRTASAGPPAARRGRRHRRHRRRGAQPPAACSGSGATGSTWCRSRRARRSASEPAADRPRAAPARSPPPGTRAASATGSGCRSAT